MCQLTSQRLTRCSHSAPLTCVALDAVAGPTFPCKCTLSIAVNTSPWATSTAYACNTSGNLNLIKFTAVFSALRVGIPNAVHAADRAAGMPCLLYVALGPIR